MATKTIKGMDELVRKIDTLAKLKGAKRGLKAGAKHVRGIIAKYPPKTQANAPRGFNSFYSFKSRKPMNTWYERSIGPHWIRKDGTVGKRKTSERLDTKWSQETRDSGLTQVIGNDASYNIYVHDSEEQAKFHGDRGWKTDEQVLREEGDQVLEFIQAEVEKELGG